MGRENIEKIITYLREATEKFSVVANELESCLNETTSPIVIEAEDSLDHLQTTINSVIEEGQEVLFLINEILP